jgi:hypothetical protein
VARNLGARIAVVVAVVIVGALGAVALLSLLGVRSSSPDDPRSGLDPDTARFTWGDRSVEVPLSECGREDDQVVMVGRRGATVLQVGADVGPGGAARTGVTVDIGGDFVTLAVFGAELAQGPVGTIDDVRIVGDSVVVEGRFVGVDPDTLVPTTVPSAGSPDPSTSSPASPPGVAGELVARCPEDDEATT